MSIRFYDQIYVIDYDQNLISNILFLKDKIDNRTLLQKSADRERFKRNKIDLYSERLNKVIENKLKVYNDNEQSLISIQNNLWQLFGVVSLPESEREIIRIKVFFELYKIIKNINPYKKKEINKDYFFKALEILKSLE